MQAIPTTKYKIKMNSLPCILTSCICTHNVTFRIGRNIYYQVSPRSAGLSTWSYLPRFFLTGRLISSPLSLPGSTLDISHQTRKISLCVEASRLIPGRTVVQHSCCSTPLALENTFS